MDKYIFTSRLIIPAAFVAYGLFILALRTITLSGNVMSGNILLAALTCVGSIMLWAIDIC